MKAITNELHAALSHVLSQLPHGQVEQLVIGLRSAVDIPPPVAAQIQEHATKRIKEGLQAQLAQLEGSPPPGANGASDQP